LPKVGDEFFEPHRAFEPPVDEVRPSRDVDDEYDDIGESSATAAGEESGGRSDALGESDRPPRKRRRRRRGGRRNREEVASSATEEASDEDRELREQHADEFL